MKTLLAVLVLAASALGQFTTNGQFTTSGKFTEQTNAAPPPSPPVVLTSTLPSATQGVLYTPAQLAASGGTPCGTTPYSWASSPNPPAPGMTLTAAGVLQSTPTLAGIYIFNVTATDCGTPALTSSQQALILVVNPPPTGDLSIENLNCTIGDVCNFLGAGPVTLQNFGIYTGLNGTPAPGSTCNATDAASFSACLASTACGDTISAALGTYSGTFTLPNKPCDSGHWVFIQTAQIADPKFPLESVRATPCQINQAAVAFYPDYPCPTPATLMPKFQATSNNQKVLVAAAGANHYRITGLEVTKTSGTVVDNPLVDMSAGADHIIIDRSLIHGNPLSCTFTGSTYNCSKDDDKQGVQFNNCTYCAVINSWVYDQICYGGAGTVSCDAQSVAWGTGANPTGPIKLYNNLLAATGENFLSGGGGGTPGLYAEIRHNHLFKPVSWFQRVGASGDHPIVKNLGEFKFQDYAAIKGNEFENSIECWCADQTGFGFLLTPKNQSSKFGGIASSDAAGNLHATTNTFGNVVSASCSTANHCWVTYNGTRYFAQTQTDSTHISVNSNPTGGGSVPPALTGISFTACQAGLSPTAHVANVDFSHNRLRNVTMGIQLLSATSDCGDVSQGYGNVNLADNLAEGINVKLANNTSGQGWTAFVEENNGFTSNVGHDVTLEHNTALIVGAGSGSDSGLGYWIDGTNQTNPNTAGGCQYGPGAYFSNIIVRNNISAAAWVPAWKSGGLLSGGAKCGLNQQFCPNHFDDGTCTYQFTKNVLATGVWTGQLVNGPYPLTNSDPASGGPGCSAGGTTCFPVLSTLAANFVNYNGGFNGDYHLATGSAYAGAATDTKDIGYFPDLNSNYRNGPTGSNPAWHATSTLTPALITQGDGLPGCPSLCPLPSGAAGTAYGPLQLTAASASDMQIWQGPAQCAAGSTGACLPHGLSITRAGILSGTPDTTGSYTVTVTMMDGAQQTATKTFAITIIATGSSVDLMQWISATNPTRTTNHMTGNSNPAYSWMDADGVKWWDLKAGTGHPWDIRTYGVNGGSNAAVCADYAPGKASICNWLTDFGSGGNFTNASAYKKQNTPFPTLPRTYTLGTMVTIDTPGPNSSVSTTNCEGVGTTNGNLGATHTVSSYFSSLAWGGSVGTQATFLEEYYYTKNGFGPYGQIYNDRERFFHVQPYGRVTWDHATWDAPTQTYIVVDSNTLTTQTAGGAPTPSFPCFGTGVTNWIGGTPGTGGNATTP